jgi:5,10-methylenetetrahydromethanopterin reductase
MKLGAIHLWGDDEAKFRSDVRLSAELGFEYVGIGDSPAGWRDLGVSMAIAAAEAPGKTVAPMVSSPFMRHPLITANMMCTMYDLTGGKTALGFATGGSTIMSVGHAPATQAEIREHIAVLRAMFAGEETQWDGLPVKALRFARPVPIIYSAFGPKAMQVGGEMCDGVALFAGAKQLGELRSKIDAVRSAARAAGRDPMSVKIWVTSYTSIRETRQAALADLKAFLSAAGMAIMWNPAVEAAVVPSQFKQKMKQLVERYDTTEHVVVGGRNSALVEELGLTEFLGDFDTVAGSPAEVKAAFDQIASMGVEAFFLALPGHSDPQPTLRAAAEIMGCGG